MALTKSENQGGGTPRLPDPLLHLQGSKLPKTKSSSGFGSRLQAHNAPRHAPSHSRLIASCRRHPCPICGRVKNSSCRWADSVIYCFCGDDHHPPFSMRIGETLQVNGREWALVSTDGGYSGNSFVFRPHQGSPRKPLPKARQQKRNRAALELMQEVMAAVDAALAIPDFYGSKPDELRHSYQLIADGLEKATALRQSLRAMRSQADLKQQIALLDEAIKQVQYQQHDAVLFRTYCLGESLP